MALLDQFVARRWLGVFFPALAVLTCIFLGGDAAGGMWRLAEEGIPAGSIALHFLLKLPTTFYLMLPVAALLATLLSLAALKRSNELGAFLFSGISRARIARPVLICALAASLASLTVNERIAPPANRAALDLVRAPSPGPGGGASTLVGTRGIWLIQGEKVVHIRSVENGGRTLLFPTMLSFTGPDFTRLASRVDAAEGRWEKGRWVLEGAVTRFFTGDVPSEVRGPETVRLEVAVTPSEFFKVRRKPEEMTRRELLDYVRDLKMAGLPFNRYALRVHRNISVALLPLVFSLIALGVAFLVPVRGGVPLGAGISLLLVMLFWSLYSFTLSLGNAGALDPALAAWGMVGLFTLAGFAFLAVTRRVRLT